MGSDWKGDKNILRRKQNVLIIKKKFLRGRKGAAMWVETQTKRIDYQEKILRGGKKAAMWVKRKNLKLNLENIK